MTSAASLSPAAFSAALESLRSVRYRPELSIAESPAPQRLAPHSVALTAEFIEDDEELASGRFVVLHDPAGVEAWEGDFRVVTFVKAVLEPDLAADPLLTGVAWTWLEESLDSCDANATALGGTVTRVMSESFGSLGDRDVSGQVEIRASWTPTGDPACLGAHAEAWAALLGQAAGLLPVPRGVAVLAPRAR